MYKQSFKIRIIGLLIVGIYFSSAHYAYALFTLEISAPETTTLSEQTVTTTTQISTGVIGDNDHANTVGVNVEDTRLVPVGWTAVVQISHLTTSGITRELVDTNGNNTVNFTGSYDGMHGIKTPPGIFTVEITLAGPRGTAEFQWTDPSGTTTTDVLTGDSLSLSNGVSVTFDASNDYSVGDTWTMAVDVFPYTGITVTPSEIHAEVGLLTGISAGAEETLSGSGLLSDSKTIMTADPLTGLDSYWQDLDISLDIHENSLSGIYTGTAILTVS